MPPEPAPAATFRLWVTACGAALLAWVALAAPPGPGEAAVVALAFFALRRQTVRVEESLTVSLAFPLAYGAALSLGPGAALPVVAGGAAADLLSRTPGRLLALNGAADAIKVGLAGLAAARLGGAVSALLAFLALDFALSHAYLALSRGQGLFTRPHYDPRLLLLDAGLAPLGLLGALAREAWGDASLLLLAVPSATALWLNRRLAGEARGSARRMVAMQKELLQARKLASLGQLAAGVAHEINNPLLAIHTNVDLLALDVEDPEGRESLDLIRQGVQRCRTIVQRLLDFSRETSAPAALLDLAATLRPVLDLQAASLRQEGIALEVDAKEGLAVRGTPDELASVLENLVRNARDARATRVAVRLRREGDRAVLEVEDDGEGMAPEVQERAFEPFFTTRPVGSGTGLGLYLVYGLVRQHGGDIDLQSRSGQGTRVRVTLPLGEAPP